jgi:predicted DNA binding CopG/RHH family protein
VQAIGEKVNPFMKKKTAKYTNHPIGDVKIVTDFLPSPKDLILKEETTKITISLSKKSLDFFKEEAKLNHTQYQRMIRNLIDQYVAHFRK